MTLKAKTIIFTTLSIVLFMAIMIGVLAYVLYNGFSVVEKDRVKLNAERVEQAFEVEIDNLSRKVSDWSSWDDTYNYVINKNKEYEESNLTDGTMVNLDLQLMAFIDMKGAIVQTKVHDLVRPENREVPTELLHKLTDPNGLFSPYHSGKSMAGFVMTSDGPFMVASRPILTSNGDGPPHGVILFARFYDTAQIKRLERVTRQKLEMYTFEKLVQNHGKQILSELQKGTGFEGITMDQNTVEGYILLKDIYGNSAFPIEITMDRNVFVQAQRTINAMGFVGLLGSVLFLLVTLAGFTYVVIRPINILTKDVSQIGKSGDMSRRLTGAKTKDEIGKLSQSINSMLQSIEYSEHLLKEERIRSKMYIDIVGTMIVVLSPSGDVTLVNKKACEVLRGLEKDIIGKNWVDTFVPISAREELQKKFKAFLNNEPGGDDMAEHANSIIDMNGSERLISWHNTVLRNSGGDPVATISTGEDITELHQIELEREKRNSELEDMKIAMLNILEDTKQLEEKIKVDRDRAKAIISTMREGLFVVDKDQRVTLINSAVERMMGMKEADMLGKKLGDFTSYYTGETKSSTEDRLLSQTLSQGSTLNFGLEDEQYIEGKNGKIPIAITITPLKENDLVIGALISFHDISKDKQVKETIEREVSSRTQELHDERAKLIASINSLNMGYLLMDTTGRPLIANSLLPAILGSNNTVLTIQDIDAMFGDSLDLVHRFTTCITDKKNILESNINYRGKILKIWIIPVVVIENSQDKVIGAVFLVEDITERKVMERSKDEFFSIASHELRTPLTAIRGNTSMIIDFYGDKITDPDLKEMITDIHASSLRLIDIVNDFLNVSRLEQGKIEFKNASVDLRDLAMESVKEFEGSALEKKVVVRFEDTGTVPMVFADRDRTKQALLNLVGNSLKFTESGEVVVRLVADGDMLRCRVNDTGRGISKDNQSLLFRKFQQAGSSLFTRDTTKGTGLGLYISRLIIEGMGGKIWLEKSEEGVGSEFCFTLPLAK